MQDVNDLRQRLIDVWAAVQQSIINDAINQWLRRLDAYTS